MSIHEVLESLRKVASRSEMWAIIDLKDFICFLNGTDYGLRAAGKPPLTREPAFNDWMRKKYNFASGLSWIGVILETFPEGHKGMHMLLDDVAQYHREAT